ncbi:MAG TPA: hypothetical protein VIV60_26250, partial [Polyangiaceae bacterium]
MQHLYFSTRLWLLALCAVISLTMIGCGDNAIERQLRTGRLQFALSSTSTSGIQYRLRQGMFAVSGVSTASVSSEDFLQAETISVELKTGYYTISLSSGWILEAATAERAFAPVEAILTSANPQSFAIEEKKTTNVTFHFRVG